METSPPQKMDEKYKIFKTHILMLGKMNEETNEKGKNANNRMSAIFKKSKTGMWKIRKH